MLWFVLQRKRFMIVNWTPIIMVSCCVLFWHLQKHACVPHSQHLIMVRTISTYIRLNLSHSCPIATWKPSSRSTMIKSFFHNPVLYHGRGESGGIVLVTLQRIWGRQLLQRLKISSGNMVQCVCHHAFFFQCVDLPLCYDRIPHESWKDLGKKGKKLLTTQSWSTVLTVR
jgi:hypothetical protein